MSDMTTETMNAATYKVSLWLQNDEGFWDLFKNQDGDTIRDGVEDVIEMTFDNQRESQRESFAYLLLLDLLGSVDWEAVAEGMREE
jgi:hypothetical protein